MITKMEIETNSHPTEHGQAEEKLDDQSILDQSFSNQSFTNQSSEESRVKYSVARLGEEEADWSVIQQLHHLCLTVVDFAKVSKSFDKRWCLGKNNPILIVSTRSWIRIGIGNLF